MPKLDGSVGQGAQNQRHDVAVVQAALGKARRKDRKPYWHGPIDGDYPRHRKALDQCIAIFQQAHRLRPSGKINRLGSDVDRLETALPASHRRMTGVPGTLLVRRRNTAALAPVAEAAAKTEATAPLPDVERAALADLQRKLAEAHGLCFTVAGIGVVGGGRFQVSLACPDSEWLDVRRNVFELGGKLPAALRKGLESTFARAARAWKLAPTFGGRPGLVLLGTLTYGALRAGAATKGPDLDALGLGQTPGNPTVRACLDACVQLIRSGQAATPAGRKQVEELAGAIAVIDPRLAKTVLAAVQTAARDEAPSDFEKLRNRDCLETGECRKLTAGEITLSMTVFGSGINYDTVRVYRRPYVPSFLSRTFGYGDAILAPDGNIYADPKGNSYSEDYSSADFWLQATFIHEMAHVWQDQQGIDVKTLASLNRQYVYTLEPGKRFLDYKLEQQGAIVADYFRILNKRSPTRGKPMRNGTELKGEAALDVYRRLLPWLNHIWT